MMKVQKNILVDIIFIYIEMEVIEVFLGLNLCGDYLLMKSDGKIMCSIYDFFIKGFQMKGLYLRILFL